MRSFTPTTPTPPDSHDPGPIRGTYQLDHSTGPPQPEFPDRFGSFEDDHGFCARFFGWYNDEHRHSGIAFHTHYGRAPVIQAHRAAVLDAAYATHPERFVRKRPSPLLPLPDVALDHKPEEVADSENP